MFGMSLAEITIIVIVILVVLGPEKIPEVARTAGKTMREIRRAGNMLRDAIMLEDDKRDRPKYTPPPARPEQSFAKIDDDLHAPSIEHEWDEDPHGSAHSGWSAPRHGEPQRDVELLPQRPARQEEAVEVSLSQARPAPEGTDGHPVQREVFIHGRTARAEV